VVTSLTRQFCKLCDVADFDDPELLGILREILPERDPATHPERKVWEFAMLALFLRETGRLDGRSELLAIGAGDERVGFWLTNRVGRVTMTDIYGQGAFAHREADAAFQADPGAHAPIPYRPDRLAVQYADARALPFPDASFDVAYTLSSIEHIRDRRGVRAAAREMARVLRPGGHAVIVTECLIQLHPRDRAPFEFATRLATLGRRRPGATPWQRSSVGETFTPEELDTRIIGPSGLRLVQPLDLSISDRSWDNLTLTVGADARLEPRSGEYYPHFLLMAGRSVFTSVCLVLAK
jgi:SAM-dependent methyltransferase